MRENILLPFRLGSPGLVDRAGEERCAELAGRVGISAHLAKVPGQLSQGERQRAALCRSLVTSPRLILADEPTGNLDSKTSIEVMGVFQKLNDQGITIVMVTHELDVARYCKRNLILRDGVVVRDAPVEDRSIAAAEMQRIQAAETAAKLTAQPAA